MSKTLVWPQGIVWQKGTHPTLEPKWETIYFEFDEETGEPFITEVRREYI